MKCPYTNNIKQVNQTRYEYNEDRLNTLYEHKLIESRTFTPCLEADCAVWVNGKCNYNQGHNG